MIKRSLIYPPQAGYQRPAQRRFWIWRDRVSGGMSWGRGRRTMWRWCCTLCEPPACGARTTEDAWEKIMTVSLPHHMRVRTCHHQYVAKTHG